MIVRDEAGALPRLFESTRGLIDYWVICDTGSTDGTQELIRRELGAISGELHQREWVDFGTNRTECMRLSRGKAEYLLIVDADMTVEMQPGTLCGLTDDAYMLRHIDDGTRYYTKRLVRGALDWRYVGTVHEYIVSEQEQTNGRLDCVTIRSRSVGAVRKGRFERDLELLTRTLDRDPADARSQFYLAQTLRDLAVQKDDLDLLARARGAYQRRAELPGWDEETYCAAQQVGEISARLGEWPQAVVALVHAWEMRPQRLEAVHTLTAGLRERRHFHTAHRLAMMAADPRLLPMPEDLLFVRPWIYEWGMLFEYSITTYWVGEYEHSVRACEQLLDIEDVRGGYREATVGNLQLARARLREQ